MSISLFGFSILSYGSVLRKSVFHEAHYKSIIQSVIYVAMLVGW